MTTSFLRKDNTSCQGNWEENRGKIPLAECQTFCRDDDRCKYALMNEHGFCYLKGNNDSSRSGLTCNAKDKQTSYEKHKYVLKGQQNCHGDWEDNKGKISLEQCQSICTHDTRCKYVVMNQDNVCYLKGNKDSSSNGLKCKSDTSYEHILG
jgi:hypothetical protein